jgi:hypothetical protein
MRQGEKSARLQILVSTACSDSLAYGGLLQSLPEVAPIMEHQLTITLPDALFQPLVEAAVKAGPTPEKFILEQAILCTFFEREIKHLAATT